LNYEQLPFKCRVCHEYGHFHRNRPENQEAQLEKEKDEGWQAAKKYKTNPKSRQGPHRKAKNPDTVKNAPTPLQTSRLSKPPLRPMITALVLFKAPRRMKLMKPQ